MRILTCRTWICIVLPDKSMQDTLEMVEVFLRRGPRKLALELFLGMPLLRAVWLFCLFKASKLGALVCCGNFSVDEQTSSFCSSSLSFDPSVFYTQDGFNQLFEQLTTIKERQSKTQIYNAEIRLLGQSTTLHFKTTLEYKKEFNYKILLNLVCSKQTAIEL